MLFFSLKNLAQDTIVKSNPVLYGEMIFGFGGNFNDYGGFIYGGNVNYQVKKNLFTIRYNVHPEFKYGATAIAAAGLPVIQSRFTNTEVGLLYGRRYTVRGRSLSFAGGISTNEYETQYKTEDSGTTSYSSHVGFAYELNIKWFKPKKERYRIYAIFPVGKPVAFGRSFGFKMIGNVSQHSYLGFGMTYGFGWHKAY